MCVEFISLILGMNLLLKIIHKLAIRPKKKTISDFWSLIFIFYIITDENCKMRLKRGKNTYI